jgi:hypothetical protein
LQRLVWVIFDVSRVLRARLKPLAGGLTPRAVLDKLAAVQMLDVNFPTTDGRTLVMRRYTELGPEQKLLVKQLKLDLPPQRLRARLAFSKATSGWRRSNPAKFERAEYSSYDG